MSKIKKLVLNGLLLGSLLVIPLTLFGTLGQEGWMTQEQIEQTNRALEKKSEGDRSVSMSLGGIGVGVSVGGWRRPWGGYGGCYGGYWGGGCGYWGGCGPYWGGPAYYPYCGGCYYGGPWLYAWW